MGEEGDHSHFIYLSLRCHHENDTCITMGCGESHFNVSLIVRDKVTRQCPQTTTFEEKGEPKLIQSNRGPSAYQRLTAGPNRHTSSCVLTCVAYICIQTKARLKQRFSTAVVRTKETSLRLEHAGGCVFCPVSRHSFCRSFKLVTEEGGDWGERGGGAGNTSARSRIRASAIP